MRRLHLLSTAVSAISIFAVYSSLSIGLPAQQLPASSQLPGSSSQGRGATPSPLPPANLQVLPRNTAPREVDAVMRSFTAGLGVTCDFCHTRDGNGQNDFAKDDLPTKRASRAMMIMVSQINQAIASVQSSKAASEIVQVECATCHRGRAIPRV